MLGLRLRAFQGTLMCVSFLLKSMAEKHGHDKKSGGGAHGGKKPAAGSPVNGFVLIIGAVVAMILIYLSSSHQIGP